jgi:UDP:flavonoid glycosyltransferase YjiC (YdhE family)
MRVRIITIGSQGDVRPYVAFGAGLRAAGHDVRLLTHPAFEHLARGRGLDYAPVSGDPREMADNRQLRALHDDGRNLLRWWRTFNEVDAPLMCQRLRDCWDACQDADVIVASILPYLYGHAIARKLNVPLVRAFYFPVSPTRAYPVDFWPKQIPLGERLNLASYHVQRQLLWQIARPWVGKAVRDVLGVEKLPFGEPFGALDREQQLLLYCYSAAVAPPPPDWGPWIHVTGYWFLDRETDWSPPPALSAFLESGSPPVYVGGFASTTNLDSKELARTVVQALSSTGRRGIVLTGWGGLDPSELPPEIFAVDWVPFDWLFRHVSAVVHHGGAGTTAAGLRAGAPTVIIPFFLDQFFWGRRVFELGVGPRPIRRKHLDEKALAAAIRAAASDSEMRARAGALGVRIRAENGVERAVAAFERHLNRAPSELQGAAVRLRKPGRGVA